jgi:general stress protein 26
MPVRLARRLAPGLFAWLTLTVVVSGTVRAQEAAAAEETRFIQAAAELMRSAGYCALVTMDASGEPQARAMDPFPPEEDMTVWLGTHAGTRKVGQIRRNPKVTLFYLEPSGRGYVTLIGDAELVDDPGEKARHWKDAWQPFYRDGNRGEDYLLIRVRPRRLEIVSLIHGIAAEPDGWKPAIVELGGVEDEPN